MKSRYFFLLRLCSDPGTASSRAVSPAAAVPASARLGSMGEVTSCQVSTVLDSWLGSCTEPFSYWEGVMLLASALQDHCI